MPWVSDGDPADLINPAAVTKAARAMARKAGRNLRDDTRRYTPVHQPMPGDMPRARKPGTARRSVRDEPVMAFIGPAGRGYRVRVTTTDRVFPNIEWSTKPHEIRAKKPGGSLRFAIGKPRRGVFAQVVQHPGTRGQHPFARGAATLNAKIPAIFAPELHQFRRDLTSRTGAAGVGQRAA